MSDRDQRHRTAPVLGIYPAFNTQARELFNMTVITEYGQRATSHALAALEDRFEVIKDIGDGSFGSVALARVRANGSSVARRGTMVRLTGVLLYQC